MQPNNTCPWPLPRPNLPSFCNGDSIHERTIRSALGDALYSTITAGVMAGAMVAGAALCGASLPVAAAVGAIGIGVMATTGILLSSMGALLKKNQIKDSIYVVITIGVVAVPTVALAMGILTPLGALLAAGIGVSAMTYVTGTALFLAENYKREARF